jgi:dolichyl-diphosphooligosaccharide--protein glycosyltransferase
LFLFAMILIALAAFANVYVRHAQLEIWQSNSATTLNSDTPTFSTADAPYFLQHASAYHSKKPASSFQRHRSYPNYLQDDAKAEDGGGFRDHPLLSVLVGEFARGDDPVNLLKIGNLGLIAASVLTAIAIAVCFGAAGYWTEGAIASLGGGLSAAYLVRSSIGRIDTDQLNLGFMYLMFGLVTFAGLAKSRISSLAWCVAAGLTANLFMWWYGKAELVFMAAVALGWILIFLQRNLVTAACGTIGFLLISGITLFNPLESSYLQDVVLHSNFIFPNTFSTITEIRTVSFSQILFNTTGSIEMGIVCLAGLALFLVRHPVIAFAYGPLVAFGLLNFVIGNRAIFYSAPIMWFGAAFLITTTARFIALNLSENSYGLRWDQSATFLAACLAMIIAWANSPTDYVPRPSFPKPVLEGFTSLKASADPTNSVVATWWDYGYASMFFNELPTFHDGGSQTTPSTHFVARAFLNPDQKSTIGYLKFLSTKGHEGITGESSLAGLQEKFGEAVSAPSPDLYLVVTSQMAGWMGSISQIGNWDIEKGEPLALRGNPNGPIINYDRLNCRLGGYPQTLSCVGTAFDLERGLINGAPLLAGWAHSQDGTTIRSKSFDHNGDFGVQIIQTGNRINVFLMHRQLFESSFNELFYLGQIDHPSISLHYDNYPHIRIYKIDGEPAG